MGVDFCLSAYATTRYPQVPLSGLMAVTELFFVPFGPSIRSHLSSGWPQLAQPEALASWSRTIEMLKNAAYQMKLGRQSMTSSEWRLQAVLRSV